MVDRRYGVGGHWLEAYPFVKLHQSSCFYGVSSTVLGGGRLQMSGPEAGLQERATQPEITAYFGQMLTRMLQTGRVEFLPNSDFDGDRTVVSRISGARFEVPESCRIVNAHYLAPSIPAEKPPPFDVADGARVLPVNQLARLEETPSQYVVVGSGKTATDACIWLLARGVDPDAICWVRPRDPWMLNRALRPARSVDLPRPGRRHHAVGCRVVARSTRCSGGSRTPAPCCASTGPSRRRWPRRRRSGCGSSSSCGRSRTSYAAGTSPPSPRPAPVRRRARSTSPTTRSSCTARRTA